VPLKKTGRLFRRGDGKWMIYIPLDLAEDSQFPFSAVSQKVTITVIPEKKTIIVTLVQE
jgi:hypothetical protein